MQRKILNIILILIGLIIFVLGSVLGTAAIGTVKLSDKPAVVIGLIGAMILLFGIFNFSNWNIWIKILLSIIIPLILLFLFVLIITAGGGII